MDRQRACAGDVTSHIADGDSGRRKMSMRLDRGEKGKTANALVHAAHMACRHGCQVDGLRGDPTTLDTGARGGGGVGVGGSLRGREGGLEGRRQRHTWGN